MRSAEPQSVAGLPVMGAHGQGLRSATPADIPALAELWFAGWQDAHASILPHTITSQRTLESLAIRLDEHFGAIKLVGTPGAPLGFHWIRGAELHQLYVDATARGAGLAGQLIDDAEVSIAASGAPTAWLACAIGNHRAARFYEKRGWCRARVQTISLDLPSRATSLDVWRYEKDLTLMPERFSPRSWPLRPSDP